MPRFNCKVCGREKYIKPSHVKENAGKYCSQKCNAASQKNGRMFACYICGKETYKSLRDQTRSKSGKFFCGKSCQTIWRNSVYVGEGHTNWKGGMASYRDILRRAKAVPICKRCKIEDPRTLTAHHKDRNRQNNSISNLIWLCHNCHYLVHHYKSETKDFLVPVA
ncbi:HNH endonuclease [Candidatus Saccharibacteria bacterium]|nr:HNH endonuclease [Candidatus Saccharibacteria bacterium]